MNYYNDNDPYCCDKLHDLIASGRLLDGDVDERKIEDVEPEDLRKYEQVHLFAGIGGWPLALELAGWPADRPVWTASCPCPPFSSAGKKWKCPECSASGIVPCPRRTGYFICHACSHAWFADARHLWPEAWRLIAQCRPPVCFGEQVESPAGRLWLAGVRASLEILGYRAGAKDLPASCGGSPHIRQRIWWMAESDGRNPGTEGLQRGGECRQQQEDGGTSGMGDTSISGDGPLDREPEPSGQSQEPPGGSGLSGGLGDASGSERYPGNDPKASREQRERTSVASGVSGMGKSSVTGLPKRTGLPGNDGKTPESTAGKALVKASPWDDFDIIPCGDGKARRVEPGTFPLAHGVPKRVAQIRAYGNAIVPQVAAEFIRDFMEME